MHEGHDQHQFLASRPVEQANALDGEFGFVEAEGGFNLPAAVVAEENAPGAFRGVNRLVGQKEPRNQGWRPGPGRETTNQRG